LFYNELSALRASLGRIWGLFYQRFLFCGFLCKRRLLKQPEAAGASCFAAFCANGGC
jgi:hypothetical protein